MEDRFLQYKQWIEAVGFGIDALGVFLIAVGILISTASFLKISFSNSFQESFLTYKHNLSRVILLGLEFLVAGDIIRTVAVTPTYKSIGILAIIIVTGKQNKILFNHLDVWDIKLLTQLSTLFWEEIFSCINVVDVEAIPLNTLHFLIVPLNPLTHQLSLQGKVTPC